MVDNLGLWRQRVIVEIPGEAVELPVVVEHGEQTRQTAAKNRQDDGEHVSEYSTRPTQSNHGIARLDRFKAAVLFAMQRLNQANQMLKRSILLPLMLLRWGEIFFFVFVEEFGNAVLQGQRGLQLERLFRDRESGQELQHVSRATKTTLRGSL